MLPGPGDYDKSMIALNQIVKYRGQYFAFYHGSGRAAAHPHLEYRRGPLATTWCTGRNIPAIRSSQGDRSSGIVVFDGRRLRLYTMHPQVDVYLPAEK